MIGKKDNSEENNEVALLKISNVREGAAAAVIHSGKVKEGGESGRESEDNKEQEPFAAEKLPLKIPLVKPTTKDGLRTIIYHCEAQYSVRKAFIEQARKNYKELEKVDTNALLAHSFARSKMLEDRLEESLIKNEKFGRGCLY